MLPFGKIALAALAFACPTPAALAQGPVHANPAVLSFRLGAMEVSVLKAGSLSIPDDGPVFGLNASPTKVAKLLGRAGVAEDPIRLDIDVLLIRTKGRTVLIDSGYGPRSKSVLEQSLRLVHVSPADVTDILLTHAHPDHVGGLVDRSGRPAFPHATIRMSAKEWRFMQRGAETRAIADAIRQQVRTFVPGEQLFAGIRSIASYGHTPGHVMYELASGGDRLLDIGDVAHNSVISVERPQWRLLWDSDKQLGATQRMRQLRRLGSSHERMFAGHFPFPGLGFIARRGGSYAFVPALPPGSSTVAETLTSGRAPPIMHFHRAAEAERAGRPALRQTGSVGPPVTSDETSDPAGAIH